MLFEVKSSTASALRKHCFFSIATYVLCLYWEFSLEKQWEKQGKKAQPSRPDTAI